MFTPIPDALPRFEVITTPSRGHVYHHIHICEMGGKVWVDKLGYAKRELFKSESLDMTSERGIRLFLAAERVVEAMNRMNLGIQAAEAADPKKGVQNVFNYLWKQELTNV